MERDDLEQRLEKHLNDVNSFNNHISNIKEKITYFKDKHHKRKQKYKKYETITTVLKSFDTIAKIATISSFITLSLTGFGLIFIPISSSIAYGLTISNKVIYEIFMQKFDEYKKQYEKINKLLNLSINYSENLYQIKYSIKLNMNLCDVFTKYLKKQKMNIFMKMDIKVKLNIFLIIN